MRPVRQPRPNVMAPTPLFVASAAEVTTSCTLGLVRGQFRILEQKVGQMISDSEKF